VCDYSLPCLLKLSSKKAGKKKGGNVTLVFPSDWIQAALQRACVSIAKSRTLWTIFQELSEDLEDIRSELGHIHVKDSLERGERNPSKDEVAFSSTLQTDLMSTAIDSGTPSTWQRLSSIPPWCPQRTLANPGN